MRSKKHLENIKQNVKITPEWLFKEPAESKINKIYNPNSLKQIARDNIILDDKHLNKELAKNMIHPYYFTDRNLKAGFKIKLESHNVNHSKSLLNITPNFPDIGTETRYVNKILKKLSSIYARLTNQYKFKYHTFF